MIRVILNGDHLSEALGEAVGSCRHRLFIATADLKDVHVPLSHSCGREETWGSIIELFDDLAARNVQVNLLHSGVPSGPFLEELKKGVPATLVMRRCVRVHAKAIIADGRRMYLGSANLTGAGLGGKSPRRRNFEAGIWTDDLQLIDPVLDMLESIFSGQQCASCQRREHCPVPLEEPCL